MFCCHAFENLVRNAGDRGLAVLVCQTEAGLRFAIQARAVAFADEANLGKQPSSTLPAHVTLSESMRVRYCPSCGKRLDELTAIEPTFFEQLADQHKPFQNEWGV